jgi:predicted acetyltransferase
VSIDVRPVADLVEYQEACLAIGQYFGHVGGEEWMERLAESLPIDRMHAARENGAIVGGAGAFPFTMTVPGGRVACAGVSVVGVYPTHRRRGVLRGLMKAQLADVRDRGEPIAALWASEERIYGRFGYGVASWSGETSLLRERGGYAFPFEPSGGFRIIDSDDAKALFPPVYEAWAARTPGAFKRDDVWWENRVVADPPDRRQGRGPKRFVVFEREGVAAAYGIYRHAPKFEEGVSKGELIVLEAIGADDHALAAIWRYLLDVDWTELIRGYLLPIDHPLFLLLAEPRRLRYRVGDGLWVRLVDIGAALAQRGYAQGGAIVFDVRDEFIPENAGRWKLEDGAAARTDDEPDIRLDVRDLGSVYLGGFTFAELQRALRVEELRDGAVARADAIFRCDVRPWCPEIF